MPIEGGEVEVISRMDAARAKLNRFFTGKPCRAGHVAQRYVLSGSCVECTKLRVYAGRELCKREMAK